MTIQAQRLPAEQPSGTLEPVAHFQGAMLTGVTVSQQELIFVNFPRWGDEVPFTVAEIKDDQPVAYPNAVINQSDPNGLVATLVSVQSVVVDPIDRLWILDTGRVLDPGSPLFQRTDYGGPKLVCVDLATDQVVKTILFPEAVALPTTYLNDVRFDLRRGVEGTAFITDSSDQGPNGIIVVDLASEKSWRRLHDHPSTKAEQLPGFLPLVEGRPLMGIKVGVDGIAIGSDGSRLYYCPLSSRRLYSVSTNALVDQSLDDDAGARTVTDEGDKGGAADGLESDAAGYIYATNYEHNAVLRRRPDGVWETVVHDPRLLWPDTLSVAANGYLYITANQLHRQKRFQGADLRRKPYTLFRIRIDAQPVLLDKDIVMTAESADSSSSRAVTDSGGNYRMNDLMTEDNYREFLQKLAAQHLVSKDRIDQRKIAELQIAMREMGGMARIAHLLAARPERTHMDEVLMKGASALREDYRLMSEMINEIGILDALDAHDGMAITNVTRSLIPNEDLLHIQMSGIDDPEDFLRYLVNLARRWEAGNQAAHKAVADGEEVLRTLPPQLSPPGVGKRRKLITGISNILGGAVALAGNGLIGAGMIPVAGPIGAAAIASAAPAVVWIGNGVGQVRGESSTLIDVSYNL